MEKIEIKKSSDGIVYITTPSFGEPFIIKGYWKGCVIGVPVFAVPDLLDYLKEHEIELRSEAVAFLREHLEQSKKSTAVAREKEEYFRAGIHRLTGE